MADTKISALPASTTPLAGTEVLPIVQGGVTKQVSVANLTAGRAVSALSLTSTNGSTIQGLTVGLGAGAVATNTAVGASALGANTGDSNTAVGYRSLYQNTSATSLASFGSQALYSNTTGSNNSAFGSDALLSNVSGAANTAVGRQALQTNTTGNSTAVGFQAGNLATGIGNQFFGYSSGSAVTTGAKNVILGSYTGSAAPISATGSNFVVLSDGDGNVRATINSSGNVLIGNTAAVSGAKLEVTGAISATTGITTAGELSVVNAAANATIRTNPGTGTFSNLQMRGASNSAALGLDILAGSSQAYYSSDSHTFRNAAQSATYGVFSSTGLAVTGTLSSSGIFSPQQATTAGAPAYVKGAMYFDTTLNKLRIGGATAWETVTSV